MKRLPIVMTLLALIVLAVSIAYWVLQLYQPVQRPLASAPRASVPEPSIDAAAGLFGGRAVAAVASNYQLTGVVAAGANGVAILVADGGVPKALQIGKEVAPGVTVREVHPRYVMLSENGVMKRVELATDGKPSTNGVGSGQGMPQQMQQQSQQQSQQPPAQSPQPQQQLPQQMQQQMPQQPQPVQPQMAPSMAPVQMPGPSRGASPTPTE
jgi:general secretion pathway protein C